MACQGECQNDCAKLMSEVFLQAFSVEHTLYSSHAVKHCYILRHPRSFHGLVVADDVDCYLSAGLIAASYINLCAKI